MNDYLHTVLEVPTDWYGLLWRSQFAWLIPSLLVAMSLAMLRPWFLRTRAERRVRTSIRRLGKTALTDVSLDNGMEGFVFIDYLVLTSTEILVVSLNHARGNVFGGEKIDQWARVMGRRTRKFPNPLVPNQERALAVKYHLPGASVRGVVLFGDGCVFPKGKPEGVMMAHEITSEPGHWERAEIPETLQAAWDRLAELAQRGAETYNQDVLLLRGSPSHVREIWAASLLLLAMAWSGWKLFAF